MKKSNRVSGFSLMELLIVVAIILVISAIAIPKLLHAKMSANEASAVGSLKVLNTACTNYSVNYPVGFPVALSYLGPGTHVSSTAAGLIDSQLAGGAKSGYTFRYTSGAPKSNQVATYTISARPTVANVTGQRYFFTDQTGVIRQNLGGVATASSPQVQ